MFTLDREVHWVRDTEAVRFLQRELNDPDLLTFWNAELGQWSLAYWVDRNKGAVVSVRKLGNSYEAGPQMSANLVHDLRASRTRTDFGAVKRRLIENYRSEVRARDDASRAQRDRTEWLRKHGSDQVYYGGNPV